MAERDRREADLRAIEALHERDMAAAKAGDADALSARWTDGIVVLPPDEPIRRGREVELMGDYAWDWGTFEGTARHRATGETARSTGKLLRILRRSPEGEWRVHRTIWNVDD